MSDFSKMDEDEGGGDGGVNRLGDLMLAGKKSTPDSGVQEDLKEYNSIKEKIEQINTNTETLKALTKKRTHSCFWSTSNSC